jgi:phage gp37-like protein
MIDTVQMPRELTDEQADAALRATAVWLDVKGSQLTVNREKMKARYQALVKFIEANNADRDDNRV